MKQEWEPLLTFMENKNVRIANLDQARQGPSFAPGGRSLAGIVDEDDDDDEDEFAAGGVDEEDEDFKGAGASSDDSSDNDSDAELIPEEGISVEAVGGKCCPTRCILSDSILNCMVQCAPLLHAGTSAACPTAMQSGVTHPILAFFCVHYVLA